MKKSLIFTALILSTLLSTSLPVIAGGSSSSCSFTIVNCLCGKSHFWVYNGNDGSHWQAASNYNLDARANVTLNCNTGNCDTKVSYNGQTYWKNDYCGTIAAYSKSGGMDWLETSSTACPTTCRQ